MEQELLAFFEQDKVKKDGELTTEDGKLLVLNSGEKIEE